MKKIMILMISVCFLSFASVVTAGEGHPVSGVVKSVDKGAKKLTISHGPIKTLGMDGMTMAFGVYDPAMLDEVKEGSKIDFVVEVDKSGAFTITEMDVK